jgi:spore coat protein U-like protein
MNRILSLLAATAALVVAAAPARATTTTANVNVTATVNASCTMTNATVAFGIYNPTAAVATDALGTLSVTCTKGTTGTITLAGTAGSRAMLLGANTLSYELYTDATRTTPWAGATTTVSVAAGTGSGAQAITVYGRIPASQFVAPGSYADTVVATLNF